MNLVQTKGNPNYGGMVTIRPRLVQLRHRTSIAIETVRRAFGDSIKEIPVMKVAGRRAIDSQAHNFWIPNFSFTFIFIIYTGISLPTTRIAHPLSLRRKKFSFSPWYLDRHGIQAYYHSFWVMFFGFHTSFDILIFSCISSDCKRETSQSAIYTYWYMSHIQNKFLALKHQQTINDSFQDYTAGFMMSMMYIW